MITLINTTWENRESVLFQPVLKAYSTCHSWMITAHLSLGSMEKQWKLFTRQMIRTHQLLTSPLQKPSALTQLLPALEAELNNLNSIHTSYQPLIQAATQLLKKKPSFDGVPVSSKCMRQSLLLDVGFSFCSFNLEVGWYSLEQNIWFEVLDKLSSTSVDFIRSEGGMGMHALIWTLNCLLSILRGMLGSVNRKWALKELRGQKDVVKIKRIKI